LTNEELGVKQRASIRNSLIQQSSFGLGNRLNTGPVDSGIKSLPDCAEASLTGDTSQPFNPTNRVLPSIHNRSPSRESILRGTDMAMQPETLDYAPEITPQDDANPPHDSICRSNCSTKGQFSSKRYEDEFYLTTVDNNNYCLSQLEQLAHTANKSLYGL
jgi:hypothetical protein